MLLDEIAAQMEGLDVGSQQTLLALVLLRKQGLEHVGIHVQQHRQGADIDDVLEQLTLARVRIGAVADLCQWHPDHVNVLAKTRFRDRPGAVVEQIAARFDFSDVGIPGLRVHGDHHVDPAAPSVIAFFAHPRLVPGRHTLDVAREDVAGAHRHAHAHHGLGKEFVGRSRT